MGKGREKRRRRDKKIAKKLEHQRDLLENSEPVLVGEARTQWVRASDINPDLGLTYSSQTSHASTPSGDDAVLPFEASG